MTSVREVFKLNTICDDPRFDGFAMASSPPSHFGGKSLEDDLVAGYGDAETNLNWEQPSLRDRWTPLDVVGRVAEYNDYPCVNMLYPAFSDRAVNALRPFLEPNGELLPLKSNTRTRFFFYNILTICSPLDRARSKIEFWCDPPTTSFNIEHFEFDPNKLVGLSIFRIRESPSSVFVTNEFVERVEAHRLRGFSFVKVWPLPPDVDWNLQAPREDGEDRRRLKQHTLALVFPFDDSPEQKAAIERFEDQMDQRLAITDLSQTYYGSYEGFDRGEQGASEYRMFFSTPDVDALLAFLRDDVRSLGWPAPIQVARRYGRMHDRAAVERLGTIRSRE